MKKEELIETIETLENNYGATIERANNSYNYGKSEIERLEKENKICEEIIIGEQQEINRLEEEKEKLRKQSDDLRKGIKQFQSDNEMFIKRIDELEKENKELKMKLLTLENKEQIVSTTVSN